MMSAVMEKLRALADADTVVGRTIHTVDGMMLIPISRVSLGFASGGDDKTSGTEKNGVWGGSGAAVKLEPLGFLAVKEGSARMIPIQPPAFSTAERVLDRMPEVLDRIEHCAEKYGRKKTG